MADFYDDDGQWDYSAELEAYVLSSSQDARLLWSRTHSRSSEFIDKLIEDRDTDLATIASIFWNLQPGFYVANPVDYFERTEVGKILENIKNGFYQNSNLNIDRYEIAHGVHAYIKAVREHEGDPAFELPRRLMGPFKGRTPQIEPIADEGVRLRLEEIRRETGLYLPLSDAEWWKSQKEGGNLWLADHLKLPNISENDDDDLQEIDHLSYLEKLFGTEEQYVDARKWAFAASDYLGKPRDKKTRRLELIYYVKDTLQFWKRAVPWLLLFFVVSMAIAIIARRINFGVWF